MKNLLRRVLVGFIAATFLLGGSTALAQASGDGSRPTYISGWLVGMTSQTWVDANQHARATSIDHSGCSLNMQQTHSSHNLALHRKVGLGWNNHGARQSNCSTVSWGRALAGTWRFQLTQINRGNIQHNTRLSVSSVHIWW